jgi:FAD/FMN-containing dehydrogenase
LSTQPDPSASPRIDSASAKTSRREFLLDAARTAAGATLAAPLALLSACTPKPAAPATQTSSSGPNWDQLERSLNGKLLRPDSDAYAGAIKIRNLRYASTRPAGVALVADAKDVATAIAWARDNRVEMVSRSGGHSFAGYCTTPGLVIDLNGMTKVSMDRAAGTMTAVGAATNEDVATAGRPHGQSLAGGQCPTVGIPGFTLGGGLGFYMRQHGLAIDALLATEMVTAAGEVLRVSDKQHPDLFWALRGGGGGNFGINTSFTFRTFAVPDQVTIFSLVWEGEACVKAFLAFQEVLLHAPNTLGAVARFSAVAGKPGSAMPKLRVFGQLVDTRDAAEKRLAPVLAAEPKTSQIEVKSFWDAKTWLAGDVGPANAFAERSRYHPRPLAEPGVQAVVAALGKAPIGGDLSVESAFFAWGGEVSKVAPTDTAFVHRNDVWLQSFDVSWGSGVPGPDVDRLLAWQDEFYDSMKPFASDRAYQNFVDPRLEHPLRAYYGENLDRLVAVKRRYDPNNVFHFAQSIKA